MTDNISEIEELRREIELNHSLIFYLFLVLKYTDDDLFGIVMGRISKEADAREAGLLGEDPVRGAWFAEKLREFRDSVSTDSKGPSLQVIAGGKDNPTSDNDR